MQARRIALVTGSNKGIGYEVCRQLAGAGMEVILSARNEAKGLAAKNRLSGQGFNVDFQKLDVTSPEDIESVCRFIAGRYGRLDLLVNNAGILPDQGDRAASLSEQKLLDVFEINAVGALLVSQKMIPLLAKSGKGKIINVSSGLGSLIDMGGGYPAYRISKAALNAITRILSSELSGLDISVNSVCPGWVRTDMGGASAPRSVEKGASEIVRLALLEKEMPTGQFLRDGEPVPW